MCFSATASFAAAAVLIPAGIYSIKKSSELSQPYWALAMLPLLFGLQQLLEGGVWLSVRAGEAGYARALALGFLLFSHVFWLAWVPYSSYLTELSPRLRRAFLLITFFGVLFGVSMYVPLLFNEDWLTVSIVKHSIDYQLEFIFDPFVSQRLVTAVYATVILVPLMLSSDSYHRMLGVLILLSSLVTGVFFSWVFVSVWCYFAALISIYIFYMVYRNVTARHVHRHAT